MRKLGGEKMFSFANKVIYQIYPKSFKDSNHDGYGDILGIVEKLDYLADLGIHYIWITPFFLSPQRDNGYDIANYYEIDSKFGTMEDLELLVKEAKKREIGIILDMVFNHTSTEHIWFQKAISGEKKYQDYYIFKDGKEDTPPTNWQSKFGGSAWEYSTKLKKWYLHLFDISQADLNWENPEVREELKNIIRFWKKKGIQGFRFDVINLISKPFIFEDDFIGDGRRFYTDGPKIHDYLKELVADTGIEKDITVGEMSSTSLEHCIRYSNPDEKELAMCFNFHHLKVDYKDGDKWKLRTADIVALKDLFKIWGEGMQKGNGWNALFWCNHDQPRIVSRLGNEKEYFKESAKMLAGMIHFMRGTPYIYQGEEIGMTNTHYKDIHSYKDVESLNYYKILLENGKNKEEALQILGERSRDNARSPMQWSNQKYAGFSDVETWISIPENYKEINVANQEKDTDSILHFYKQLIKIRKDNLLVSEGDIKFIESTVENVLIYKRSLENKELWVYCNLGDKIEKVSFPILDYINILGNYTSKVEIQNSKIFLRPFEFLAIQRKF